MERPHEQFNKKLVITYICTNRALRTATKMDKTQLSPSSHPVANNQKKRFYYYRKRIVLKSVTTVVESEPPSSSSDSSGLTGVNIFSWPAVRLLRDLAAFTCFLCLHVLADQQAYGQHLIGHLLQSRENDRKHIRKDERPAGTQKFAPNAQQLLEQPFVVLFQNFYFFTNPNKKKFHFELALTKGTVDHDFIQIKNTKCSTLKLGQVHVFNTVTSKVLLIARDHVVTMLAGETIQLEIANDALGICKYNIFLLAFATTDGQLLLESYKLFNGCCGNDDSLSKHKDIDLDERPAVYEKLAELMKPPRKRLQLKALLKKFKMPQFCLTPDNYAETLRVCCSMDQIEKQVVLDSYTRTHLIQIKHLHLSKQPDLIKLKIPFVVNEMPYLDTYSSAVFQFKWPRVSPPIATCEIVMIQPHAIIIRKDDAIKPNIRYRLSFKLGSITYDLEHLAINAVQSANLSHYFFPAATPNLTTPSVIVAPFEWQHADIAGNALQMQAVRHIVSGTAAPQPYLLFGPPGTGKTKTLVEAIYQVLQADATARLLVCATSNAAADELMLRLNRVFYNTCPYAHQIYRQYAKKLTNTRQPLHAKKPMTTRQMDDVMVSCSNYCRGAATTPTSVLAKYRVIVCTLTMSGVIGLRKDAASLRFTHVFVDECGSAEEAATLVALLNGITPETNKLTANVVLAGDPKQLGPVIKSDDAIQIGYDISMLERLLTTPAYAKNPVTNAYNPNLVTKLVNNYRSHPTIIAPSNRLFYDNDLRACGPPERTDCFVNWPHLPNPDVPIVFHALINTKAIRENGISWHNPTELEQIVWYVRLLLAEPINGRRFGQRDIAVITPYRQQAEKLSEALCANKWPLIAVATVERFQGQEKPIVLMSTVRSRQGIGFLCNERRMNVMLTRAQALQVVVGDPLVLGIDRHWRDVLRGWKAQGVCTGDAFELEEEKTQEVRE